MYHLNFQQYIQDHKLYSSKMANFGNAEDFYVDQIELNLTQPKYNGKNITNHVLVQQIRQGHLDNKSLIYYIPTYVWIKIKNFTNIAHENLEGQINVALDVAINLKDIPQIIKQKIRQRLIIRFNRDEAINLGDQSMLEVDYKKLDKEPEIECFTVRKILKAGMVGQIFFSPFQMIYLILSIKIQDLEITQQVIQTMLKDKKKQDPDRQKFQKCQNIKIMFNLMDINQHKYQFSKILYSNQGTYGRYDLAEQKLHVEYTNTDVSPKITEKQEKSSSWFSCCKKNKQKQKVHNYSQIRQFSFAHFQIPLYNFPIVGIFTIFVPLWLLGVINLGIFFQDTGLADRIGSLAGLMIAFVALITVIRQQLPLNPDITMVQILVYLQTLTTIFCFIQSLQVRESETYEFIWNENGWFIASMAIQIFQFIFISLLYARFLWNFYNNYNKSPDQEYKADFSGKSYQDWDNFKCDEHFRRKIDNREIQVLRIKEEKQRKKKEKKIKQQEYRKNKK